jgi:hypothetical protein
MPTASKASRSEAKTAAEAELAQRQETAADPEKGLKSQAREERKDQREQLAAGKKGPSGAKLKSIVAQRTGDPNAKPLNGLVDNMTRRDGADPLEGHFVTIDYSAKATASQVQAQLGDHVEPGVGSADYGVYLGPGEIGEDGYPVTAIVFLRDEHAAQIVVPYDSLRRATSGGRR